MDDVEFLSVLNDTEDGLSPADGYAETIAYAEALIVYRDQVRPVVKAALAWRQALDDHRTANVELDALYALYEAVKNLPAREGP